MGRFRQLIFLACTATLGPACGSGDNPLNKPENVIAAAPSNLVVSGTPTTSKIDLTWTDNSDNEFEFRIQRSDDLGLTFTQVGTALKESQSFTDYGLRDAKTYQYKVVAWNSKGDSPAAGPLIVATVALGWAAPVSGGPSLGRANHSAVYDGSTSPPRMLVYGGFDANTGMFSDELWALPLPVGGAPGAWAQLTTTGLAIPGLLGHSAVVDTTHTKMLVFGGQYFDSLFNIVYSNEIYVLDLATLSWSNPAPTGTRPSARAFQTAFYDAARKQLIVNGGYDGNVELSDTFVLNLTNFGSPAWTGPLPGIKPIRRQQHAGICDTVRNQVIIFGGIDNDGTDNSPLSQESWSLSLTPSLLWTPMVFTGTPDKTSGHSAIFDAINQRMLVFGGQNTNDPVPFLNNMIVEMTLEGVPRWRSVFPSGSPAARYGHTAVYDAANGRMVIYGGYDAFLNVFDDYCVIQL